MVNGKVNGSAEKGRSFLKHPCETPRRSGVRCLSIITWAFWLLPDAALERGSVYV